ncbi:hypothetical protein BSKO_02065 [Bryopsis sp. KO-2023]|nr:hypothetical protein BSKO_02065 [Bryopsis sp. KO-2023]
MTLSTTLQVAVVAAVLGFALAFPTLYPGNASPGAACDSHPEKGFHDHGDPVEEAELAFVVKDADGDAVTEYCPGSTYDVMVTFPSPFKSKLTVSVGELGEADAGCPNMANFVGDEAFTPLAEYSTEWTIPCSEDGDADSATLTVTGATSESSKYLRNKLTLTQKDTCDAC